MWRWVLSILLCVSASAFAVDLKPLSVKGTEIVDADGQVMLMRGINFGCWLITEPWMNGLSEGWEASLKRLAGESGLGEAYEKALKRTGKFDDDVMHFDKYLGRLLGNVSLFSSKQRAEVFWSKVEQEAPVVDERTLDGVFRKRFGDAGAAEIWKAYHETWFREDDFKKAAELGFNFVRVPFWYHWFEDDAAPYTYQEYGFQWLDKAVAWAKNNGLYVALDQHGAPGGQSPWDHTGEISRGELFKNPEYQRRTCALWKAIADRYKDEAAVFMYGCLNEPFSARNVANWTEVHDGIYRAIRSVDARHIVMMEDGYKLEAKPYGVKGFFPLPSEKGWSNVVYSFHFYEQGSLAAHGTRLNEVLRIATMERKRCGVPLYIGEFNSIADTPDSLLALGMYMAAFNERGIHWSPWAMKITAAPEKTLWGIYQFNGEWKPADVYHDSKEAILAKIALLSTDHFVLHEALAEAYRSALKGPVAAVVKE